MGGIAEQVAGMLKLNFKARQDSYSDQFHRVLVVKVLMAGSFLLGLNWFSDEITCIVPGSAGISGGYVQQACWIQGLFIYRDINSNSEKTPMGYYGIGKSLRDNGRMSKGGQLCRTDAAQLSSGGQHRNGEDVGTCEPMEKTFYLQYQWFPFIVALYAMMYYAPYALFRMANSDLVTLKTGIKKEKVDVDSIFEAYFNKDRNQKNGKLHLRVMANYLVKILYIVVNLVAFSLTDRFLNGNFASYGSQWHRWTSATNEVQHQYATYREAPKPAEVLLPSFGMCEVVEVSKDVKYETLNTHTFVCEISQHVLYQYVLVILWFTFVAGMVISCAGLVAKVLFDVRTRSCYQRTHGDGPIGRGNVYPHLTLREIEYLEYIRKKDLVVYDELMAKLEGDRRKRRAIKTKRDIMRMTDLMHGQTNGQMYGQTARLSQKELHQQQQIQQQHLLQQQNLKLQLPQQQTQMPAQKPMKLTTPMTQCCPLKKLAAPLTPSEQTTPPSPYKQANKMLDEAAMMDVTEKVV